MRLNYVYLIQLAIIIAIVLAIYKNIAIWLYKFKAL